MRRRCAPREPEARIVGRVESSRLPRWREDSMKISVDIDTEQVIRLTAAVLRQLPYAANNAITRTAKEAVDAGQKEVAADLQKTEEHTPELQSLAYLVCRLLLEKK